MTIQIYNTLTREKETFIPIQENKVGIYVCGPTVYNYIHIGNARPAIVFDTGRRYFEYKGYEVNYVLSFTDVDDKIIATANELGEDMCVVTNRFVDAYLHDVRAVRVREETQHPRLPEPREASIE